MTKGSTTSDKEYIGKGIVDNEDFSINTDDSVPELITIVADSEKAQNLTLDSTSLIEGTVEDENIYLIPGFMKMNYGICDITSISNKQIQKYVGDVHLWNINDFGWGDL
eukprot:UN30230